MGTGFTEFDRNIICETPKNGKKGTPLVIPLRAAYMYLFSINPKHTVMSYISADYPGSSLSLAPTHWRYLNISDYIKYDSCLLTSHS